MNTMHDEWEDFANSTGISEGEKHEQDALQIAFYMGARAYRTLEARCCKESDAAALQMLAAMDEELLTFAAHVSAFNEPPPKGTVFVKL